MLRRSASGLLSLPVTVEAPRGWSKLIVLRERLARFEKSAAGRYWSHLSTA
jgi:hypothetical protein